MKKLSLLPAVLAAVGLMIVLNGNVSAHPGIEGVFECHEEEGDDVERAVLLENEDDGDEAARTLECDDCEDDDEPSRAVVADDCEDDDDHNRAAVAEDKEEVDSEC